MCCAMENLGDLHAGGGERHLCRWDDRGSDRRDHELRLAAMAELGDQISAARGHQRDHPLGGGELLGRVWLAGLGARTHAAPCHEAEHDEGREPAHGMFG